ncbi:MAG: Rpn family recombination-promoting nuclease/putative transposase [Algicola sp.]|nr:Rpn family recombination-promoting nuclease/putative transposase [Algicola sp.]
MAKPTNPHDKFFRSSMRNAPVAQAFFQYYLPAPMLDNLELDSFHLENSTYIDEALQETLSDLVFTCRYSENVDHDWSAKTQQRRRYRQLPNMAARKFTYHRLNRPIDATIH